MPSSAVRIFTEPAEYGAAIRQGTHQITITQSGTFTAKLHRIDFHRLWMQRFSESLSRTTHVDGWGERAVISFKTHPGPRLVRNGVELRQSSISQLPPGQSYYQYSSGASAYGAMSLPLEELASLSFAIVGRDLRPPDKAVSIVPAPAAMAKLQQLHAAAGLLAEEAPAVIAHPEGARGLEQALTQAMIDCLSGGDIREDKTASRLHTTTMRRFHRIVEEYIGEPLYVAELCRQLGVSERTLRFCCQEHLQMSPKRYLLLRRLHLFRQALRESAEDQTTVTELATRYGFWQFGRLAGEYKSLFREFPSATLAHPM
jgi:AraC-like DNA-binding protein